MSDEAAQFAAIKALIPGLEVYDYGRVPGLKNVSGQLNPGHAPTRYVLLSIERRFVPQEGTRAGRTQRIGYRAALRICAKTPSECRAAAKTVSTALDGAALTVAGAKSTPLHHDSSASPEADDGYYAALHQWTYAL